MSEKIKKQCQSLHLSGLCQHFEAIFKTASQKNWTHHQLLESLFDLELDHRLHKRIQLRLKQAKLPATLTIESFDFAHHPSRKKNKGRILQLMQLDFIKNSEDVILIGNPGVGKTHLALCLAYEATQNAMRTLFTTATDMINHLIAAESDHSLVKKLSHYTEPDLLLCDEIGYLPLDQQGSSLFFQVISRRHQRKSTFLTTNLPFAQWGNLFDSTTVATAIADRLVMNSEVIILEGESYRRNKRKKAYSPFHPLFKRYEATSHPYFLSLNTQPIALPTYLRGKLPNCRFWYTLPMPSTFLEYQVFRKIAFIGAIIILYNPLGTQTSHGTQQTNIK